MSQRLATRRFGRFTVPAALAHRFDTDLKRVMGLCIVFRAEHLFASDDIEYWAASEHFRPVALGEVMPEYRWIFDNGHPRAEEVTAGAPSTIPPPPPPQPSPGNTSYAGGGGCASRSFTWS